MKSDLAKERLVQAPSLKARSSYQGSSVNKADPVVAAGAWGGLTTRRQREMNTGPQISLSFLPSGTLANEMALPTLRVAFPPQLNIFWETPL